MSSARTQQKVMLVGMVLCLAILCFFHAQQVLFHQGMPGPPPPSSSALPPTTRSLADSSGPSHSNSHPAGHQGSGSSQPRVKGFWQVTLVYPEAFKQNPYDARGELIDAAEDALLLALDTYTEEEVGRLPWRGIVEDQYQEITASQLHLTATDGIQVTYSGREGMMDFLRQKPVAEEGHFSFSYTGDNPYLWEYPSLIYLQEYCRSQPDALVFYIHSKGARYNVTEKAGISTWQWRKMLEHFVIKHHEDCVGALRDQGYRVCGADFREKPSPHYTGNFWWARCDFINTRPALSLERQYKIDRFYPEKWLCENSTCLPAVDCMSHVNKKRAYYQNPLSPIEYKAFDHCKIQAVVRTSETT